MNATSGQWLVRSGGRILGPFEKTVVEQMLRSKELVVFDEVALPLSRWIYIRDSEHYIYVVEEIRSAEAADSDTGTQTETVRENTVTGTDTGKFNLDEMTAEISSVGQSSEIVYEDVDESFDQIVGQGVERSGSAKSAYGVASGNKVKQEVERSTKGLWFLTSLVILGVFAYIGYNNFIKKPTVKAAAVKIDLSKAHQAMAIGDERAALRYLQQSQIIEANNDLVNLELGIRLIQIEGQTVKGKRLLQGLTAGRFSKKAKIGVGLAELIDGNHTAAIQVFRSVLDQEPTYIDAHINWGVAELEKRNFEGAALHFRDAFANRTSDGLAYLLYADSLVSQWQANKDNRLLKQAVKALDQYIKRSRDYRQEALLMKIFALVKLNKDTAFDHYISEFLDIDPAQTDDHKHNIYIDRRKIRWSLLTHKCQAIADFLPESVMAKGMNALCFLKAGESARAMSVMNDALLRAGHNPQILAINAHILFEVGQVGEAQVAIGKASELNMKSGSKYILPAILDGRLRRAMEDFSGSKEAWLRAYAVDPKSVQAYAGLARSFYEGGSVIQAEKHLTAGLKLDPTYGPLLKLRSEMKQP